LGTRLNVHDGIPFRKQSETDDSGESCDYTLPILSAWGTREDDPFTPDLAEPVLWVGEMQKLGVAMVNVSMGNPYANPHVIRRLESPRPAAYQPREHPLVGSARPFRLAAELQRAFPNLPMVGSGYSYLQEYLGQAAAANVRDGRIAIAGAGRATLA